MSEPGHPQKITYQSAKCAIEHLLNLGKRPSGQRSNLTIPSRSPIAVARERSFPQTMVIDIHAHYVTRDAQDMAPSMSCLGAIIPMIWAIPNP